MVFTLLIAFLPCPGGLFTGQIELQISKANPSISPQQMQQVLVQQYITKIKVIQQQVCEENNTTEEAVQKASDEYANDAEFQPLLATLSKFNNTVVRGGLNMEPPSAEDLARVPADLTVEKVITIFTAMMEKMSIAMENTCTQVKNLPNPPTGFQLDQLITEMYLSEVELIKTELLATHGYEESTLDAAVLKYQQDPTLIDTLTNLQVHVFSRLLFLLFVVDGGPFSCAINIVSVLFISVLCFCFVGLVLCTQESHKNRAEMARKSLD